LSLAAAIKDRSNIVNAYLSLGNLHYQKKDYDKSNNYFNLTLKEAKEMRHTETIASSLQGLANNYLALGHFLQADEFITEAVEISETHGFFDRLNQQYPVLANIKANLGQHKEAYHYLSKHTALNDSLNNVGLKKAVNELEHKYQVANKEKEMAEKLLEIEAGKANIRKKNIWLIASAAGIVTIALLLLYGYRLYRQKQQYHEQYVKALQKEQDLAKLKAQLEGRELERNRIAADMHDDIGGSITSILFLAEGMRQPGDHPVSETKKIAETARNLMGSVNEIIWSMNSEYDTVEDLVAYIRNHMSEFLGAVNLDYTFCIPDEIPAIKISGLERRNIYLVIKELLHNIAKHANATRVEISFSFTKKLKITVQDNGKGIDLSSERRFGNGLKNMKARMGAINGTFCIRNDVGTVAELSIPLTL
jgi:signal transduction histidine kinase